MLHVLAFLTLSACSSLPKDIESSPEQFALSPATTGPLAEIDSTITQSHGSGVSGFWLLDKNADALTWRLALIDQATTSLDLMYYLWYADDSGRLMLERVIRAAERGVKVRLLVDDLLLIGGDKTLVALDQIPTIQLRVFNPWTNRKAGRGVEFIARLNTLNSRMHKKLVIADNHAAILGGRNIGDHYFGLGKKYNFHDLDVLGFGEVTRQSSSMFDNFWNSSWVIPAYVLPAKVDQQFINDRRERIHREVQAAANLAGFPVEPRDWSDALAELVPKLHFGSSEVIFDKIIDGELVRGMTDQLGRSLRAASQEILLMNAYIIPDQDFIDTIKELTGRGVQIRILTNSLATYDIPIVNSHYKKWRKPIVMAGGELFEMRHDAAIKSRVDTAPVHSKFIGFHSKAYVVDRRQVFIGSMNFDPRSANINTEMGVLIDSPSLGEALAILAARDMAPDNAWQVMLDERQKLIWVNSDETVTKQPARNAWQRFLDGLLRIVPKSQAQEISMCPSPLIVANHSEIQECFLISRYVPTIERMAAPNS